MNRGPFIFIGVFAIISLSWALTLIKPIEEAGNLEVAPSLANNLTASGKEMYTELGCVACHTQQVRVVSGMDIEREWGTRQSMPIDYAGQTPVFTGQDRVGPDLTTVGARRSDANWHLLHFYNSQITSEGSNMPPYAFLFETREIVGRASNRALNLPAKYAPKDGYEVVPTRKAEALVAYMLSLNIQSDIREAPTPERIGLN